MEKNTKTVTIPIARLTAMEESIAKLEALVKYYEGLFLNAKRHRFGTSSERCEIDGQLSLFDDVEVPEPPKPELEEITYKRKKQKGKREADISDLPVVRVDYELSEEEQVCPECGEKVYDIGVNTRREIEITPAKAFLKEHACHSYACRNIKCDEKLGKTVVVKADAPKALIAGSLASPSLVAHIAIQKYSNGLPLYRIEKGFCHNGINISRQTMSNWVIKCTEEYLEKIYYRMSELLLKESVLHADETTVQVLHEPNRPAQSKSYEWIYRTSGCSENKIVIYDYKETRKQEHPQKFLRYFKGYLHTDGYQVYHNLPPGITVVGCWAHARRPWEKAFKILPKEKRKGSDIEKGLAYINALFDLERKFKELMPEERYERRLQQSKPVAETFFVWANSLRALPKCPLGEAIHYAMSQRKYLMNVFLDGRLELSNNRAERSVKPFVMGRKAWLFSNTPEGAKASSIMYSIIETAKENGLNPFNYLKFLLEQLSGAGDDYIESLLPWSEKLPERCRLASR